MQCMHTNLHIHNHPFHAGDKKYFYRDPVMIDGSQFFKSAVSLVSVNFDDAGVYSVTVKVADASGNNKLVKVLKSEVTVRGRYLILQFNILCVVSSNCLPFSSAAFLLSDI